MVVHGARIECVTKMAITGVIMMTSSNGNIFRITGHLCGEFNGPGEFPTQRPVTRSFDVFFDLRLNKQLSKNSGEAGDLRRYRAHYDVTVMISLWPSDTLWWHISGLILAQVMPWCSQAPSHFLNQCWLITSKVPWHSSEGIIKSPVDTFE